jgi:hypothetical protein
MENVIKIKVDFNNETLNPLLNFVRDTQDGKYTKEKPILPSFKFTRMEIQENNIFETIEAENQDEVLLFGISY